MEKRHLFDRMSPESPTKILEIPRVNPVGIMESPVSFETSPRKLPLTLRLVAGTILIAFTVVGTVTTVVTLGAYCLTTHAGSRPLLPPNR